MKPGTTKTAFLLISALAFSAPSFACQDAAGADEQRAIQMNSKDVTAKEPTIFNLRSGHCEKISAERSDGEVMDFLPVDEQWQGLYVSYRAKGDDKLHALSKTYKFMMREHADDAYAMAH